MLKKIYINRPYLSRYILFVAVHLLTIALYFLSSFLFDIHDPLWTIAWVLIPTAISLIIVWKLIHFFANGRDAVFCIFWLSSLFIGTLSTVRPATDLLKINIAEVDSIQEALEIKDGMFKAKFDFDLDYDNMYFRSDYISSYGFHKIGLTSVKYQKKLFFPLKNVKKAVYQWNYGEPDNSCFAEGFAKTTKSEIQEMMHGKLPKYFTLKANEPYGFCIKSDNYDYEKNNKYDNFKYMIIGQEHPGHLAFMKILKFMSIVSALYLILGACIIRWKKS